MFAIIGVCANISEREGKAGSIKAAVKGIDPGTAERIVEGIRKG